MAGYSGTPLPKKLGIKEGSRVRLLAAPSGFEATLPPDVQRSEASADIVIVFAEWEADLLGRVEMARAGMSDHSALWIAWPKKASKRPTDLTEDRLRALYLPTGLVDNKVCAIDGVWSGLRFVLRVELRRK